MLVWLLLLSCCFSRTLWLRRRRLGMVRRAYKIYWACWNDPKNHVSLLGASVLGVWVINEIVCFYDVIRPYVRLQEMLPERLCSCSTFISSD